MSYAGIIASSRLRGDTTSFITTWETTTASESITIPTAGSGYNYDVDWGDGSTSTSQTGDATHTYTIAGTYTVKISGAFPRIFFNDSGDKDKILSVEQWGTNAWGSMNNSFNGCSNLIMNATDAPTLTAVVCTYAFRNCTSLVSGFADWDMSNQENLSRMFAGCTSLNDNLGGWDVSNVTDFTNFLNGVTLSTVNYDALLNGWNTLTLKTGVPFHGGNSKYSPAASAARANLVSTYSWTIVDGGPV